ncbi:MAG: hypothetical protein IPM18_03315 [Phycisphaerales bacterium]|nr:hypothetical protein [Phycisphaerales bacterium]
MVFRWYSPPPVTNWWLGPGLLGGLLVGLGCAILIWPELLSVMVATLFLLAGLSLLGFAWNAHRSVRYRRMDEVLRGDDPPFSL